LARSIVVEEVNFKPVGDSSANVPTAYRVTIDGGKPSLYFSRRQAADAVADALTQAPNNVR
jgi:hypothetical protein